MESIDNTYFKANFSMELDGIDIFGHYIFKPG